MTRPDHPVGPPRIGHALTDPDRDGRTARFAVTSISDDDRVVYVRYEGHQSHRPAAAAGEPDVGDPVTLLCRRDQDQPVFPMPRSQFRAVRLVRWSGAEIATVEGVIRYLISNYVDAVGRRLTTDFLRGLVRGVREDNPVVAEAIRMGSFCHYPGDQIAQALGFIALDDEDVEPEDDDD